MWQENYANKTSVSQFVMAKSKLTYKGDAYMPWALLVSALYQLDDDAEIVKCMSSDDTGYVFTDKVIIETVINGVETKSTVLSHMVKVKVKFMDKWFEEIYPIQDKDYSASKVYDQNGVNKALQRCLARTISLATGIGWNLYEQTELQFDPSDTKPTPVVVNNIGITKVPAVNTSGVGVIIDPVENLTITEELARAIYGNRNNEKVVMLINSVNTVLAKKFTDTDGSPLNIDLSKDDNEVLNRKLGRLDDPEKMLKGIKKTLGYA